MNTFLENLNQLTTQLPIAAYILASLLGIQIINWLTGYRLNLLGLRPRKVFGLIGIPISPLLHGNFAHLLFNSLPLFAFSSIILVSGLQHYLIVTAFIMLGSGMLLWLFGRPGIHVGASGVIMGYLGYIFLNTYYKPSPFGFLVGIICFYYFGGLFLSIVPTREKQISWDGHLFGLLSGLITAYLLNH